MTRPIAMARLDRIWPLAAGAAVIAGVVDYALMPTRLSPGWELVLPPAGVMAGPASLGTGLAIGLALVSRRGHAVPLRRRSPAGLIPPERYQP